MKNYLPKLKWTSLNILIFLQGYQEEISQSFQNDLSKKMIKVRFECQIQWLSGKNNSEPQWVSI